MPVLEAENFTSASSYSYLSFKVSNLELFADNLDLLLQIVIFSPQIVHMVCPILALDTSDLCIFVIFVESLSSCCRVSF